MKVESHDTVKFCKHCHSGRIRKEGVRRNKPGDVQLMKCTACGKRFSANFGFRYRRHSPAIVSEALHLFYSGMSSRAVADAFEARDIDVDGSTIRRWVERYSRIAGCLRTA